MAKKNKSKTKIVVLAILIMLGLLFLCCSFLLFDWFAYNSPFGKEFRTKTIAIWDTQLEIRVSDQNDELYVLTDNDSYNFYLFESSLSKYSGFEYSFYPDINDDYGYLIVSHSSGGSSGNEIVYLFRLDKNEPGKLESMSILPDFIGGPCGHPWIDTDNEVHLGRGDCEFFPLFGKEKDITHPLEKLSVMKIIPNQY